VADFASDLLTALSFLHSRGLVYCDLKPSNILLDENGHLKLGDFGLTRRVTGDVQSDGAVAALPPAKRGTPAYMVRCASHCHTARVHEVSPPRATIGLAPHRVPTNAAADESLHRRAGENNSAAGLAIARGGGCPH
jgi:hypothetical protein